MLLHAKLQRKKTAQEVGFQATTVSVLGLEMFGFIETNLKSQSGENIAAKMTHGSARESRNHMKNG